MVPLIFWNVFYSRLLNYTILSFLNIFWAFVTILVITAAQQFFCILSSHNAISETNNQVRVLGEINERYEAYCDVLMYVPKRKFQLRPNVSIFCCCLYS